MKIERNETKASDEALGLGCVTKLSWGKGQARKTTMKFV